MLKMGVCSTINHIQLLQSRTVVTETSVHGIPPGQEYWSGRHALSPGIFPTGGIKPRSPSCIAGSIFTSLEPH